MQRDRPERDHADDELPDLDGFGARVYWLVRRVPYGRVATYGQIALYAGSPRAARAVGQHLKRSLPSSKLPWHRIINHRGAISFKGDLARAELQRQLLVDEGVDFDRRGRCDLDEVRWSPGRGFWDDTSSETDEA